jgi:hypothetical protein
MLVSFSSRSDTVKSSELEIWSLQIPSFERIQACNYMLVLLEHHQSIQHGQKSLLIPSEIGKLKL